MNGLDGQDVKNSTMKIKESSSIGKRLGALPRSSSWKKICSLKKKAAKSLPEVEDSEEYSAQGEEEDEEDEDDDDDVDEIEYFFQEAAPYGILTPSKGNLYRQVGQRVLWKPPKNAIPAHLISWPAQEKIKTRSGLGENIGVVYKPKEKEQDEAVYSDYGYYGRKRPMARREGLEHKRMLQKVLGGRLLRESMGIPPEEFWIRSGAKPKVIGRVHGSLSPQAMSKEQGCPPLVKPKKKRIGKPPLKRRGTRCEVEEVEVWEMPKSSVRKGRGTRRSLYKRR
ncbi:uncharacterized protein LOC121066658 isoform X2 [Cygnus olor]|uniref:uncharacterized protein LOC121066658 isoform X2 n=1 Tax=Cygnus olor TaxID=8869 RepID=UPI001ADE40B3|nr:uncharacterized protein LOC121066658 isoform X2 [Cygnus olor]